jgi:hypothetical protein
MLGARRRTVLCRRADALPSVQTTRHAPAPQTEVGRNLLHPVRGMEAEATRRPQARARARRRANFSREMQSRARRVKFAGAGEPPRARKSGKMPLLLLLG